ncbi:MAG: SufE family protein [Anaerolineae bacterium]|nr:SufE family protein [Caldilineales bacterium]MDW8270676.1 SufE family protein [Anaerolineae bacterium]
MLFTDPDLQAQFNACTPRLQAIIREFREATPSERVEYMIEYAEALPDLPPHLQHRRGEMETVHECQTPVLLLTEVEDGRVHFHFDIPRESPTVRGYAGILAEGLNGASPTEVLATPDDLYRLLGLHEVISHLRLRGLHALLGYIKRQTLSLTATPAAS